MPSLVCHGVSIRCPFFQMYSTYYLGVRAPCNRRNAADEAQRIRSSARSRLSTLLSPLAVAVGWTISRRRCALVELLLLVALASCFAGCSVVVRSMKSSFSGTET